MPQHIEMIVDYLVVGDDLQYSDNHGVLIRCKDCRYWSRAMQGCVWQLGVWHADDFCSRAERIE